MFRSINRLSRPLVTMISPSPPLRYLKEWTGKYLPNHEWIFPDSDKSSSYKMGLARSGLEQFTELVYIDFPIENGDKVEQGDDLVILESVKASDSIAAPYDCEIIFINEDHDLGAINNNPECIDNSWLIEIRPIDDQKPRLPIHSFTPWGGHRSH